MQHYYQMKHLSRLLMHLRDLEEFQVRAGIIKDESELRFIKCSIIGKDQLELFNNEKTLQDENQQE